MTTLVGPRMFSHKPVHAPLVVLIIGFVLAFAGDARASFGVERFEEQLSESNALPAIQAGSHPYAFTTRIVLNHHSPSKEQIARGLTGGGIPDGDIDNLTVRLPPGLIANLLGVERCSEEELALERCPLSSQVGVVKLESGQSEGVVTRAPLPVYNVEPSSSEVPGELGFNLLGLFVLHIVGSVAPGSGYAISAETPGIPQQGVLYGVSLTLWGDPSAASHDGERAEPGHVVPRTERPFLTLPTSCTGPLTATMSVDSWQEPKKYVQAESLPTSEMSGCENVSFTPSIEVKPETTTADTPTGVQVTLKVPQPEDVSGLAEANLKEATVTLPAGVVVSPATVDGLEACTEQQIALADAVTPSCPESSKIASVEIVTPLLQRPLIGGVYLAQPKPEDAVVPSRGSNPFGSMVALYLVAEGEGVVFKTAGEVQLNQSTGQLTARFGRDPATGFYLPQLPFSELKMDFFGGPRAPLVAKMCGSYTTTTMLTPWSAPASGPPATPQSSFEVSSNCSTGAFAPTLSAGTLSNQAGSFSPFTATFSRQDGEQEIGSIQVHTPPGLLGELSHVPLCGKPQAELGACGPESEIGTVTAVVGPGADPYYVTGGKVYLTDGYRGAPFGLTFVVPAEGGPFNLGHVIVRAAINIDRRTAALIITSDPLPTILMGVPLQVRSISVNINRPKFMVNPTSCKRSSIIADMQGSLGTTSQSTVPFQAGDCSSLKFEPGFMVATSGKTSRIDGASLDVKLSYPSAMQGTYTNIASVKVELPSQLPARLTTLQKACLEPIFETDPARCPSASVVGVARATTPLLPVGLSGPAYFVSNGEAKFPELVIVLQGDGVRVDLHGETAIAKSQITTSTFRTLPDVPVSTFELYLPEGKYSALTTSGSLCHPTRKTTVDRKFKVTTRGRRHEVTQKVVKVVGTTLAMRTYFTAQDGAVINQDTKLIVTGCPMDRRSGTKTRVQIPMAAHRARHVRDRKAVGR